MTLHVAALATNMPVTLVPILIGFFLIMLGMAAASVLGQALDDYVESPQEEPPAQADEEGRYDEPDLR